MLSKDRPIDKTLPNGPSLTAVWVNASLKGLGDTNIRGDKIDPSCSDGSSIHFSRSV